MLAVAVCGRTPAETTALGSEVCSWADNAGKEAAVCPFDITELNQVISDAESDVLFAQSYDIFIIDAKCGCSSGVDAADNIRRRFPCASVILLSDNGAQARDAYAANAVRLLIKPFTRKALCEALCFAEKACSALKKIQQNKGAGKMPGEPENSRLNGIVYISNAKHSHVVRYSDGTSGSGTHRSGLGEHFSELLELPHFVRISSSCIIGINHVTEVYSNCVVMSNGEIFRLGRNRRDEVINKIQSAIAGGHCHRDIKIFTTNRKQD